MVDFKTIKKHVTLLDVFEHDGVVLRKVNQYQMRGSCPLPQHEGDKESFTASFVQSKITGEWAWVWSCHSKSCSEKRGRKGGDLIEYVRFAHECSSVHQAGELLEEWFGPFVEEPRHRKEEKEVAPVQVDEKTAAVNPKRYMEEVDDWLFELLRRGMGESWEEWQKRVSKEIKIALYSSYQNGVNVGKGSDQEYKGPIGFHRKKAS